MSIYTLSKNSVIFSNGPLENLASNPPPPIAANAYIDEGADGIFLEAVTSIEQYKIFKANCIEYKETANSLNDTLKKS